MSDNTFNTREALEYISHDAITIIREQPRASVISCVVVRHKTGDWLQVLLEFDTDQVLTRVFRDDHPPTEERIGKLERAFVASAAAACGIYSAGMAAATPGGFGNGQTRQ